jgi:hypothetical protein
MQSSFSNQPVLVVDDPVSPCGEKMGRIATAAVEIRTHFFGNRRGNLFPWHRAKTAWGD